MTYAERMLTLCPRHSRQGKVAKRGFRCICREIGEAFQLGYDRGREALCVVRGSR